MPPGMALIVTLRGSNYRCLEQIFMVPKGFEPSKFDCICAGLGGRTTGDQEVAGSTRAGSVTFFRRKNEHNTC